MYCSKCGEKNNNTAVFCTHCGNELKKIKMQHENICQKIELKPKKISCFLYVLLWLYCIIFISWVLFFVESNVSTSAPNETLIMLFFTRIICLIGILGSLFASIMLIKAIIKNKPIIIVDENGITNNNMIFSNKNLFIPWDNIENIDIMTMITRTFFHRDKLVRIYLKQPIRRANYAYMSLMFTGIKYENFLQQVLEYKKMIGK